MALAVLILYWLCLQFVGLNSSGTVESLLPIGFAHVIYPYRFARSGSVDEFAVTHINAHVAEGSFHGVEENQVAWLELIAIDFFSDLGLFLSSSRQYQAYRLFIHVAHKAAAIKAFFFAGTAPFVGHTQKAHSLDDNL